MNYLEHRKPEKSVSAKDRARIEAMNQSEDYYYDYYGFHFEEFDNEVLEDETLWHRDVWDEEREWYFDWLWR